MLEYIQLQKLRYATLRAYRSSDWKKVSIKENGQPLIQVMDEIAFPFYAQIMNLVEDKRIYLREEVLDKILQARSWLQNRGFDLKVYDGWRSFELQEKLFWYYMRKFTASIFDQREQFEGLDSFNEIRSYFGTLSIEIQTAMLKENCIYISWPSKNPIAPSPHMTGGAVDVWLFESELAANLGTPFDWMDDDAGAFYHLKFWRKRFSINDRRVCRNRSNLIIAMIKAGFSCYGPEFWHFNYGNQMDALVKRNVACYSYIEL